MLNALIPEHEMAAKLARLEKVVEELKGLEAPASLQLSEPYKRVSNSTAEQNAISRLFTGDSLAATGLIRWGVRVLYANESGVNVVFTARVRVNGTQFLSALNTLTSVAGQKRLMELDVWMRNTSALDTQLMFMTYRDTGFAAASTLTAALSNGLAWAAPTINTALDFTPSITIQMGVAHGTTLWDLVDGYYWGPFN